MTGVYTMKKVVSLLLALAMCLSLTSFAWADNGITTKAELESAIDSAENGATITLAENIDLTAKLVIPAGKTFTLDLNGHDITQTGTYQWCDECGTATCENGHALSTYGVNAFNLSAGDNVTITDTGAGTGTITGNNNGVYVPSGATLTITGGTIKGTWSAVWNEGTLNVGGTADLEDGNDYGVHCRENSVLNVTGGTIAYIYNGETPYNYNYTANVSAGTIARNAVVSSVTGGTFDNLKLIGGGKVSNATINKSFSWTGDTIPTFENVTFGANMNLAKEMLDAGYILDKANKQIIKSEEYAFTVNTEDADKGTIAATWRKNDNNNSGETNTAAVNAKLVTFDKLNFTATVKAKDGYAFEGWYLNGARIESGVDEAGTLTVTIDPVTESMAYVARFVDAEVVAKANEFVKDYAAQMNFTISSTADMDAFAYAVTNLGYDFSGKTVKLTADLDFKDLAYRVVGDETRPFKGTFDAKKTETENYTIYNITTTTGGKFIGLFGNLNGAKIQNLTLKDSKFDNGGVGYAGGIAADADHSTITNCIVSNVTTSGWFSGAVIGHTYGGVKVEKVTVTGCAAEGGKGGAIVGYAEGVTIEDVTVSDVKSGAALIGHANATGENAIKIDTASVDAPDVPLINTTYSDSKGSISITGEKTSIKTKEIIPESDKDGAKTITVSGGTFNIDVTDYREDGKLVKVETVNGSTQYTIVEDGENVPAGTYTTAPQDPADDHVVRKDGENSYTVLPDNKDNVSEGTYVTEPSQVPGGYEVVDNKDGTWTVKKSAPRYYYTASAPSDDSTAKDDSKKAPRTFDPGVGIYALTAVLSVTGMALVGKRKD